MESDKAKSGGGTKRLQNEFSLTDWVSFIQGYKSWADNTWTHYESYGLVLAGAIFVLGGLIWGLGFDVFLLFVVMAGVPLGAFAYLLFKRRKSAIFWLIEILLLIAWLVPLLLQITGVEAGGDAPDEASPLFWGSYFAMPVLGVMFLYIRSHVVQLFWLSHGLDMLTQAIMYGQIRDTEAVKRRFQGMVGVISMGYRTRAVQYARFRCLMDRKTTEGLSDDVLHQWIVQTGGSITIQDWLKRRAIEKGIASDAETQK